MWVAAQLCGEAEIARRWAATLRSSHRIDPSTFPGAPLNATGLAGTVPDLATQLPFSREGVYALQSRPKPTNPPPPPAPRD